MSSTKLQAAKGLLLATLISSVPFVASAQKGSSGEGFSEKWSIGLHGGATVAFTDIKQYDYAPVL